MSKFSEIVAFLALVIIHVFLITIDPENIGWKIALVGWSLGFVFTIIETIIEWRDT